MTKYEFLKELKAELEKNQVRDVSDILADYEEHFNHGQTKGKTEQDIATSLGSPYTIAQAYQTERMIEDIRKPETGFRFGLALSIIIRLLILAPFNFIVLFIPGIIILSLLFAGWSVAVAFGSAALGVLWFMPSLTSISSTIWMIMAGVFTIIGLLGLSIIGLSVMFFITRYIVLGLISYLQWNLKFVMENRS